MRFTRFGFGLILFLASAIDAGAQTPPAGTLPAGQRPTNATPPPGARPGGGQRRLGVQVMTLTSTAWPDGGSIPARYTQAGEQVSPALTWSNVPDNTISFVLIARNLDAAAGNGTDDVLHWMLWNIPGASRNLAEGMPPLSQFPDGTRQISVSGPYYRGPGAPASGPAHHYTLELYALDATIDIPAVGQTPAQTRAAVVAAMAGKVRGKGVYVGLFKRP